MWRKFFWNLLKLKVIFKKNNIKRRMIHASYIGVDMFNLMRRLLLYWYGKFVIKLSTPYQKSYVSNKISEDSICGNSSHLVPLYASF